MTRVAIVGAGFSGIGVAIALRREGIEDFRIFERGDASGRLNASGPQPAPVCCVAVAISSRSDGASVSEAASIQPSTCAGVRAPTMAPVTPGHASVHAIASAETEVSWRVAIRRSASRKARFRPSRGCWNSGARRRQSSSASDATRSAVKLSVSRPDCIGL